MERKIIVQALKRSFSTQSAKGILSQLGNETTLERTIANLATIETLGSFDTFAAIGLKDRFPCPAKAAKAAISEIFALVSYRYRRRIWRHFCFAHPVACLEDNNDTPQSTNAAPDGVTPLHPTAAFAGRRVLNGRGCRNLTPGGAGPGFR